MKLKTLKDIENQKPKLRDHPKTEVCSTCLKQEAIKWVKDIDVKYEIEDEELVAFSIKEWIMHFFNITEDDLE